MAPPPFWLVGCLAGASSVAFGAFGAHGLKSRGFEPAKIANFQTAAHYQVRESEAMCEDARDVEWEPKRTRFGCISRSRVEKVVHS